MCVFSLSTLGRSDAQISSQLNNVHVHHEAHGAPKDIAIPIDMWEEYYRKAESMGLLIKVFPTSESEPIWREMDTAVKDALRIANLEVQSEPGAALDRFGSLDWALVRPSYKSGSHSYVMKRDRKLQAMEYTVPKLVQISPWRNPKEGEGGEPVIFLGTCSLIFVALAHSELNFQAPKYGHLRGRIDGLGPYLGPEPAMQHLLHACFADRFYQHALPAQYSEDILAECSEHCDGFYVRQEQYPHDVSY